jgi:hypothetical protein
MKNPDESYKLQKSRLFFMRASMVVRWGLENVNERSCFQNLKRHGNVTILLSPQICLVGAKPFYISNCNILERSSNFTYRQV